MLNHIPTGCCHVILIYGLIPPIAGRNRVKEYHGGLDAHFFMGWVILVPLLTVNPLSFYLVILKEKSD